MTVSETNRVNILSHISDCSSGADDATNSLCRTLYNMSYDMADRRQAVIT